ncbi:PREDICTED: transmembrane protein 120 homolog [Nicrophorus vespilloides]|uniref:Transmembrane protein 120 homolog n=1 Tax=Nicrophorus vespilloides TaxID=110193 RepID=A0ABM1MMP4_NICVS|nr:PREDICTED: transmembrane protein 120 homolog [Nicrophorus vespilloides]
MSDTSIFEEWEGLANDYKVLENSNKIYQEKLSELASLQKKCMEGIKHQNYRMGIISKSITELTKKGGDKEKIQELEGRIIERKAKLQDIEQTLPKQNGMYLKIILGNVNVSILNKEEKFKYKDEYEKFKLILSMIGFVLSVLNQIVIFRPLELSYIFLLVWYYCTLTIRESILKVNGSRIKGWWRFHHFLSTVVAGILLIWPDVDTWEHFRNQFMMFNCYISVVQYLQFRYQMGVLYRLKALGERHNMDITIEGFHSWMWRGLSFLIPFLFGGYLFQLYNAYVLMQLSYHPTATWHVSVLSVMFLVLFIGNTTTTLMVIPSKKWEKMKVEYSILKYISETISRKVRENGNNGKKE